MGARLGERTVFRIAVANGRNVSAYSANGPNASLVATGAPTNEFEVMLLPGTATVYVTECPTTSPKFLPPRPTMVMKARTGR